MSLHQLALTQQELEGYLKYKTEEALKQQKKAVPEWKSLLFGSSSSGSNYGATASSVPVGVLPQGVSPAADKGKGRAQEQPIARVNLGPGVGEVDLVPSLRQGPRLDLEAGQYNDQDQDDEVHRGIYFWEALLLHLFVSMVVMSLTAIWCAGTLCLFRTGISVYLLAYLMSLGGTSAILLLFRLLMAN